MNKQLTQEENKAAPKLSTQPYKGARDFYPEDMRIRSYIFDVWRKVCKRYGFEEYDFPILEPFEIYAAKTGEEIVNEQMFTLEDKGGRKLAIRPELTPGTVRMLAASYNKIVKPIKWFMIGNNWRFEKPQKGRGREFNQLEVNIFGIESPEADFEMFQTAIDIMKEFGADEKQFRLSYSDRRLISALLKDKLKLDSKTAEAVRRNMDKRKKISKEEFFSNLSKLGVNEENALLIEKFMTSPFDKLASIVPEKILQENKGYITIIRIRELLEENKLDKFCSFDPSIIRGFDYSDGLVYEVFDLNPENRRSMFGGERFDKLIDIFGEYDLPATGYAMGDVTLLEFLTGWNLLPDLNAETQVLVTVFDEERKGDSFKLAQQLRSKGVSTYCYLEPVKLDKQLKYADRKGIPFVVVLGPDELEKGVVQLKDMKAKKQEELTLEAAIKKLKK